MKEQKDESYFQEVPNKEVADLLYDLGQRIKKEFDEPILGEMVINHAIEYRIGLLQEKCLGFAEMMQEQFGELIEEEVLDDMQEQFKVDEEKIH